MAKNRLSECAVKCCTIRTPNLLERKGIAKRGARSRLPCVNRAPEPRVKTHLNTRVYLCFSLSDLLFAGLQIIFYVCHVSLNNSNPQSNLRCHLEVDHFISFENRCRLNFHVSKVTTTKLTFALSHILASYHLPCLWHATFRCAPGVSDPIWTSTAQAFIYIEICKSIFDFQGQYFNWRRFF